MIIFLICLFTIQSFATDINENAGTAGLSFLKVGTGARASAMGEAFVAIANDATGSYWNPAGLSFIKGVDVSFMHNEWFQDVRYEFLGAAINDQTHAFGLSATYLTVGDIERRQATGDPLGTYSAYDWSFVLSYSNKILDNLSIGTSGKLLYEKIHYYEAKGFAFDFGLIYLPLKDSSLRNLRVGAAIQNIGPKMKFIDEEFKLPQVIKVGLAYDMPITVVEGMNALIAIDGVMPNDNDMRLNTGCEIGYSNMAFVRAGYKLNYDTSDFTFGAGYKYNNYKFDYAFVPYSEDLGNTHKFSFGVNF